MDPVTQKFVVSRLMTSFFSPHFHGPSQSMVSNLPTKSIATSDSSSLP
jgi:hypothetical protein